MFCDCWVSYVWQALGAALPQCLNRSLSSAVQTLGEGISAKAGRLGSRGRAGWSEWTQKIQRIDGRTGRRFVRDEAEQMTPEAGAGKGRDWTGTLRRDRLRSAGILKLMSEVTAEPAGFGEYFFARGLGESEHHFLVFERVQKGDVVFVIDDDDGENRP